MRVDPFRPRDPRSDALGAMVSAFVLTGIGLLCVFSFGARNQNVIFQGIWAAGGVFLAVAVSRVPLSLLRRTALPALCATGALLLGALLFAPTIGGTRRWFELPGKFASFQPSELAKLAVVLFLADRLARMKALEGRAAILKILVPVALICVLVLLAPDLGTTVFLAAVAAVLLILAGARVGRLAIAALLAVPLVLFVASHYPYMQHRLEFFRGERNYQQEQALVALGSGGVLGKGLGAGRQKMHYLPAGDTDFTLANLGEEMGFLGVAVVGALFAAVLVYGARVAIAAARKKERFGFYVAAGATFVVVFQAVSNIAVASAAAPTKGISLPFLSKGGSNLLMALLAVGLVVNVGRGLAGPERRAAS